MIEEKDNKKTVKKYGYSAMIALTGYAKVGDEFEISKDEKGIITLTPAKVVKA